MSQHSELIEGDCKAQFIAEHELAWFATKGAFCFPSTRPSSVMQFKRVPLAERTHPTEKPVSLMEFILRCTTSRKELVLDPFMGTGATGVACARLKRRFIGCELESKYVSIARRRVRDVHDGFDVLPLFERD